MPNMIQEELIKYPYTVKRTQATKMMKLLRKSTKRILLITSWLRIRVREKNLNNKESQEDFMPPERRKVKKTLRKLSMLLFFKLQMRH